MCARREREKTQLKWSCATVPAAWALGCTPWSSARECTGVHHEEGAYRHHMHDHTSQNIHAHAHILCSHQPTVDTKNRGVQCTDRWLGRGAQGSARRPTAAAAAISRGLTGGGDRRRRRAMAACGRPSGRGALPAALSTHARYGTPAPPPEHAGLHPSVCGPEGRCDAEAAHLETTGALEAGSSGMRGGPAGQLTS